jgi:small GTP-binding protein
MEEELNAEKEEEESDEEGETGNEKGEEESGDEKGECADNEIEIEIEESDMYMNRASSSSLSDGEAGFWKEMINMPQEYHILLMGDQGCGKTTYMNYLDTGKFTEGLGQTYGYDFRPIQEDRVDARCKIYIWDHSGMPKYVNTLGIPKRVDAVIIAFDLSNENALAGCEKWEKKIEKWASDRKKTVPQALLGLKMDLAIKVDHLMAHKFGLSHNQPLFEASAKEGFATQAVLDDLIFRIRHQDRSLVLGRSMFHSCWPAVGCVTL